MAASPNDCCDKQLVAGTLSFNCKKCGIEQYIPATAVDKERGVSVSCFSCGHIAYISPDIWCANCGAGIITVWRDLVGDESSYIDPVEKNYVKYSKKLVAKHGELVQVDYLSHFPKFEIKFHYMDGSSVYSGERTGRHDIHFLSMGYAGEGPRYATAFLKAAGFPVSYDDIISMSPGSTIKKEQGKIVIGKTEKKFLAEDDFIELSNPALVAFAARLARWVQPLLKTAMPGLTEEQLRLAEQTISRIEKFAEVQTFPDTDAKETAANMLSIVYTSEWSVYRGTIVYESTLPVYTLWSSAMSAAGATIPHQETNTEVKAAVHKATYRVLFMAYDKLAQSETFKELVPWLLKDFNILKNHEAVSGGKTFPATLFAAIDNDTITRLREKLKKQHEGKAIKTPYQLFKNITPSEPEWAYKTPEAEFSSAINFDVALQGDFLSLLPRWALIIFCVITVKRAKNFSPNKELGNEPLKWVEKAVSLGKEIEENLIQEIKKANHSLNQNARDGASVLLGSIYCAAEAVNEFPERSLLLVSASLNYSLAASGFLSGSNTVINSFTNINQRDFVYLYLKARSEKWTDETPIQPDLFTEIPPIPASALKQAAKGKSGCFIATACYGDYESPEVTILREYRDRQLLQTRMGRLFVKCYYLISPPVARGIGKSDWLKKFIRRYVLQPIIIRLNKKIKDS